MPPTRTPVPPTPDERVYTLLLLLTLALRPLPDDAPLTAVQIDTAQLWQMAAEAGAPLGRNRFHAAVRSLAEDPDGEGWEHVIFINRQPQNRRSVLVVRVQEDPDGWEEPLDSLGLTVDTATEAARLLGLDTESPLPADLLQPLPVAEEDEAAEVLEKSCTRCHESKPLAAFPWRGRDYDPAKDDDEDPDDDEERPRVIRRRTRRRPHSWCRACTAEASRAAEARRHPDRRSIDPAAAEREQAERAAHPRQKRCRSCQSWRHLSFFYRDAQKHDGRQTVCKSCASKRRADQRLRAALSY
jgi:hypothetical protein